MHLMYAKIVDSKEMIINISDIHVAYLSIFPNI